MKSNALPSDRGILENPPSYIQHTLHTYSVELTSDDEVLQVYVASGTPLNPHLSGATRPRLSPATIRQLRPWKTLNKIKFPTALSAKNIRIRVYSS